MSGDCVLRLDPFKAADQGRRLEFSVPLSSFKRLQGILLENEGEVNCKFVFSRGEGNESWLQFEYCARLTLRCERCLGKVTQLLEDTIRLRLIDSAMELASDDEESIEVGESGIYLPDVIEDELLLALPLIPKHGQYEQCDPESVRWLKTGDGPSTDEQAESPFAILRKLKH